MVQQRQNAGHQKTAIAPMLAVRRGAQAIEFYKAAFGAAVTYRVDSPDGAVVAQLSVNGADFWIADESPQHENFSPESLGGGTVRIILVVEDPDVVFDRAVKAGAAIVWDVSDQHGWRIGRIADPFGHHWEIGKPLHP
jgi:PhnB protein